jgi:hypothetical protein
MIPFLIMMGEVKNYWKNCNGKRNPITGAENDRHGKPERLVFAAARDEKHFPLAI